MESKIIYKPKNLSEAKITELKKTVLNTVELRNKLMEMTLPRKPYHHSFDYYITLAHNMIKEPDYGERDRFYLPYYSTSTDLSELMDIDEKKFVSAFKTIKAKVIAILNRYIKEMELGFVEHDLELMGLPIPIRKRKRS